MKSGLTQLCINQMNLADGVQFTTDCGYQSLELRFHVGTEPAYGASDAEIQETGEFVRGKGLEIPSILVKGEGDASIISPQQKVRERQEEFIWRGIEICKQLDCDGMLLHPGHLTGEDTYSDAWRWAVESLQKIAPAAENAGVTVNVENVWNRFILSPREAREFVDAVGSRSIGWYLDAGNLIFYGYAEHWVRELGARIKKVHVKDFNRRERKFCQLLDGDVNWPVVMSELREIGFDGCLVSEVGGDQEANAETAKRIDQIIAM